MDKVFDKFQQVGERVATDISGTGLGLSIAKEIVEAKDSEAKWKEKEAEYAEMFANPYNATARGYIDEVIKPEQTREKLIKAFKMLENKAVTLPKKKHGNIPL